MGNRSAFGKFGRHMKVARSRRNFPYGGSRTEVRPEAILAGPFKCSGYFRENEHPFARTGVREKKSAISTSVEIRPNRGVAGPLNKYT